MESDGFNEFALRLGGTFIPDVIMDRHGVLAKLLGGYSADELYVQCYCTRCSGKHTEGLVTLQKYLEHATGDPSAAVDAHNKDAVIVNTTRVGASMQRPLGVYLELCAKELGGAELVGRQLWVYRYDVPLVWNDVMYGTWGRALVTAYDAATSKHTLRFVADGAVKETWLAAAAVHVGAKCPAPGAAPFRSWDSKTWKEALPMPAVMPAAVPPPAIAVEATRSSSRVRKQRSGAGYLPISPLSAAADGSASSSKQPEALFLAGSPPVRRQLGADADAEVVMSDIPPPGMVLPEEEEVPAALPVAADTGAAAGKDKDLCEKTSKYRGVSWNKRTHKWQVTLYIKGCYRYFGSFADQDEAGAAYDRAALVFRGARADLNFPITSYLKGLGAQQLRELNQRAHHDADAGRAPTPALPPGAEGQQALRDVAAKLAAKASGAAAAADGEAAAHPQPAALQVDVSVQLGDQAAAGRPAAVPAGSDAVDEVSPGWASPLGTSFRRKRRAKVSAKQFSTSSSKSFAAAGDAGGCPSSTLTADAEGGRGGSDDVQMADAGADQDGGAAALLDAVAGNKRAQAANAAEVAAAAAAAAAAATPVLVNMAMVAQPQPQQAEEAAAAGAGGSGDADMAVADGSPAPSGEGEQEGEGEEGGSQGDQDQQADGMDIADAADEEQPISEVTASGVPDEVETEAEEEEEEEPQEDTEAELGPTGRPQRKAAVQGRKFTARALASVVNARRDGLWARLQHTAGSGSASEHEHEVYAAAAKGAPRGKSRLGPRGGVVKGGRGGKGAARNNKWDDYAGFSSGDEGFNARGSHGDDADTHMEDVANMLLGLKASGGAQHDVEEELRSSRRKPTSSRGGGSRGGRGARSSSGGHRGARSPSPSPAPRDKRPGPAKGAKVQKKRRGGGSTGVLLPGLAFNPRMFQQQWNTLFRPWLKRAGYLQPDADSNDDEENEALSQQWLSMLQTWASGNVPHAMAQAHQLGAAMGSHLQQIGGGNPQAAQVMAQNMATQMAYASLTGMPPGCWPAGMLPMAGMAAMQGMAGSNAAAAAAAAGGNGGAASSSAMDMQQAAAAAMMQQQMAMMRMMGMPFPQPANDSDDSGGELKDDELIKQAAAQASKAAAAAAATPASAGLPSTSAPPAADSKPAASPAAAAAAMQQQQQQVKRSGMLAGANGMHAAAAVATAAATAAAAAAKLPAVRPPASAGPSAVPAFAPGPGAAVGPAGTAGAPISLPFNALAISAAAPAQAAGKPYPQTLMAGGAAAPRPTLLATPPAAVVRPQGLAGATVYPVNFQAGQMMQPMGPAASAAPHSSTSAAASAAQAAAMAAARGMPQLPPVQSAGMAVMAQAQPSSLQHLPGYSLVQLPGMVTPAAVPQQMTLQQAHGVSAAQIAHITTLPLQQQQPQQMQQMQHQQAAGGAALTALPGLQGIPAGSIPHILTSNGTAVALAAAGGQHPAPQFQQVHSVQLAAGSMPMYVMQAASGGAPTSFSIAAPAGAAVRAQGLVPVGHAVARVQPPVQGLNLGNEQYPPAGMKMGLDLSIKPN